MATPTWLTGTQLKDRWGNQRVTDLAEGRKGDSDLDIDEVIDQAICDAESTVRSILGARRYVLSTLETKDPATLERLVADLTYVKLHDHYAQRPPMIEQINTATIADLKAIAKGDQVLDYEGEPSSRILSNKSEAGTFTLASLEDF